MRVLSILNVSNREKPGSDSGFIFHRLLFERLANRGWHCTIASPIPTSIPGTEHAFFEVGSSKYDVRFRFDWDEAASLICANRPDLLFVHQVELVSNYRALLVSLRHPAKLVTYCHYWPLLTASPQIAWDPSLNDAGLAEGLLFRILAATTAADIFFVTSEYARELIISAATFYRVRLEQSRIKILPCPADPEFLTSEPRVRPRNRKVLYNHRLYQQYGTDFLLQLMDEMRDDGIIFTVTDVLAERNSTRRALDPSVDCYQAQLRGMPNVEIRNDGHFRDVYRNEIIGGADVALAPFRVNANWSMSAVDCFGMGVPVVCPRIASFPEFAPNELLFETKVEAASLIRRLLQDDDFWRCCSARGQVRAAQFSADLVTDSFLTYFDSDG